MIAIDPTLAQALPGIIAIFVAVAGWLLAKRTHDRAQRAVRERAQHAAE